MGNEIVSVDAQVRATVTCEQCGKQKTVDASKLMGNRGTVRFKAKCHCGNEFGVILQRRQLSRKKTGLPGTVYFPGKASDMDRYPVDIVDISQSGMRFAIARDGLVKVNDRVIAEFELDDKRRSAVQKALVIRNIAGNLVGAEFERKSAYDSIAKYIGFAEL